MEYKWISYFGERTYQANKEENEKKLLYWSNILGKAIVDKVKSKDLFSSYICCDKFKKKKHLGLQK